MSKEPEETQELEEPEEAPVEKANIWMTLSFYLDAGSTFRDVLKDARTEREVRGENVLIFAHNHDYAEDCGKKCRRIE